MLLVNVHALASCGLPAETARLKLVALGDFSPDNQAAEDLPLGREGSRLPFPLTTRALEARVNDGSRSFAGYSERHGQAGLELLLWPELEACPMFRPDGALGYPGRGGGQAFGYAPSLGLVLAAGGNDPLVSDAIVGALTFDVSSGKVSPIDTSERRVLREPRGFATTSEFGGKLLVAGGENPVFGSAPSELEPRSTAEVFDPATGSFEPAPIQLVNPRTRHAALTLPNGDTLLVGGRSKSGASSYAQYQLERVSPTLRRSDIAGTATVTGRIEPAALRLTDGRIFVGGGLTVDESLVSDPVGEWLSADGAELEPTQLSQLVPARFGRAFVATPGGGLLAVGGCEERPPSSAAEAEQCRAECARGCPPEAGYDAWWIDADGAATAVALDDPAPENAIWAPRPILIPGSEAAPWLVAARHGDPRTPVLFRFNPWRQRFVPDPLAAGVSRLPRPGSPQPIAVDPDAFVWLDDSGERTELVGLRLGTRNRYASDAGLVLLSDPLDPSRPRYLAPARPAGDSVSYNGALSLRPSPTGGSTSVLITDAEYTDFTLTIQLVSGPPPIVVIGETAVGGPDCPWPDGGLRPQLAGQPPTLRRTDTRVELSLNGGQRVCSAPAERAGLGLRASPHGESRIRQLEVKREGD